jgi:hypothetical protein
LFSDNSLVYIVEFPFSLIKESIKKPVINAKVGKRVVCHFGYKDYDSESLVVHYLNESLLASSLSKDHMQMLLKRKKK